MALKMNSNEEKEAFEKICSISKKSKETVRDVLRAILISIISDVYSNKYDSIIPYICKLNIDHIDVLKKDKKDDKIYRVTKVNLKADPMDALIEDISAVVDGEDPSSLKFFREKVSLKLKDILDIHEE